MKTRIALLATLSVLSLAVVAASGGVTSAAADPCPNEAIRAAQTSPSLPQGSTVLPACMALEMVSPPQKFNQYARGAGFSTNGDRIEFFSIAALADTPQLSSIGDTYIGSRTASGWVTKATVLSPDFPGEILSQAARPCAYSTDLSRWNALGALASQRMLSITTAFEVTIDGSYSPISPTLTPQSGANSGAMGECEGGSADASMELFTMEGVAYLEGDPMEGLVYLARLDENGEPSVELLARDSAGTVHGGSCGVKVGGETTVDAGDLTTLANPRRGTVSPDGSRIYFTTRPCAGNPRRIMVRRDSPTGPQITQLISSECTRVSPVCSVADGDEIYLGASQEGEKVYFETTRQLANSDFDTTNDIYLYDGSRPAGSRLTQVSAGDGSDATPGSEAEALGLGDFSGDGSHAYFVARDVLTTSANPEGDVAQGPALGEGVLTTGSATVTGVTTSSGAFAVGQRISATGIPAKATIVSVGAGTLEISAPATASGPQPLSATSANLYLYERDAAHPSGRTAFIGTLSNSLLEQQRWMRGPGNSNSFAAVPSLGADPEDRSVGGDGHVLVFETVMPLSAGDQDGGRVDLYRYDAEAGTLDRVSAAAAGGSDDGPFDVNGEFAFSGTKGTQSLSFFRGVSEDGETIVFSTKEALDPTDANGAENAYIWREGSLTPLPFATSPTVSLSGEQVGFTSSKPLLPQDGDTIDDVYVARTDGGFPFVPPPDPCAGEACQGPPAPAPQGLGALSDSYQGQGNPPRRQSKCKRGSARKHGKCVKRARKHKRANRNQGGRK